MRDKRADEPLEAVVTAGMLVAILTYGGIHPAVVAVAGLLIGVGLARRVRREGTLSAPIPVWVMLIAGGLGLLQIVPLPPFLLELISPESVGLRSFALGERWLPLSYAPGETGMSVARSALVALAALAGAALSHKADIHAPIRMILIGGAVVLGVIIVHAVFGAESIYGLKAAVGRGFSAPLGPFVNANHLAAFLVLVVPVAAAAAWAAESSTARAGAATVAVAGAAALVATFSRGGMVALVAATVVFGLGVWATTRRARQAVIPLAGGVVAAVLGVAWTGGHVLFLFQRDLFLAPRGKGPVWEAGLSMLADHSIAGIGRGSFGSLYPSYGLPHGAIQSGHVENSYLAMLLDFGIPLGLLVLAGAALVARKALRSRIDPLRVGAWAGLAGLAVHNLVDYNIELPGVAVPASILLGALCATEKVDRGQAPEHPILRGGDLEDRGAVRFLAVIAAVGVLGLMAGWRGTVEAMDARVAAALEERPVTAEAEAKAVSLASKRPTDPWSWLPIGEALIDSRPADALVYINRAMVLDPRSPRPHESAVRALLRLGRDEQAAGEARRALEKASEDEFEPLLVAALKRWPGPTESRRIMPRRAESAQRTVAWFQRAGRADEALAAARAWASAKDAGPRATVILAELLSLVRGEAEDLEARMLISEVLDQTKGWELDRALLVYGRVQLRRGAEGWAELEEVLARIPRGADPRVAARASYLEARIAEAEGDLSAALERARTASRLLPDAPEYQGELARVKRKVEAGR